MPLARADGCAQENDADLNYADSCRQSHNTKIIPSPGGRGLGVREQRLRKRAYNLCIVMARSAKSPNLRLYLLGAFRLERDGEPVALPTRKAASLLAYLVLHPQEHSREQVAALFWGDSTDTAARRSLRVALTPLRAQLGADAFIGDSETIQFNPEFGLWVDAREIDGLGISDLTGANPDQIKNQKSKIENYSELLPGFYDDWVPDARERLRGKFVAAALQVVQAARAASEYEQAIEVAHKVLQVDRANEAAHQHLIFCYVVTGKRNTALEQYAACERALREELAIAPSDETRALAAWVRQSSVTGSMAGQVTNLPIPASSFIGRRREVSEVKDVLRAGRSRVLTLLGAGGSGKTRLAIQVGTELVGSYSDGIWWVELAALSDPALVPHAVARALGVTEAQGKPITETVLNFLRERVLLLILDNCEHLVAACASIVDEILTHCSRVTVLTTSREVLNVYGEAVWSVPTLGVPQPQTLSLAGLLMEYESVRLFVERARAGNAQFELTEQNAIAVAQICRRLDGIPMALELAAARVRTLSVQQVASRLDDRFQLLTGGSRTALPRQQTLRALVDWSYALLNESERELFCALSVFRGGWTVEACEGMVGRWREGERERGSETGGLGTSNEKREGGDEWSPVDVLGRLVDKSLLSGEAHGDEIRFTMSETIREYARLRLQESGRELQARQAHLDFFQSYANELAPQFVGALQKQSLDAMEQELDNVRAALDWTYESEQSTRGLQLTVTLSDFWIRRAHFSEGRQRFQRALDATRTLGNTPARGRAFSGMATLASLEGDHVRAIELLEQALDIFRAAGDKRGVASSLHMLGVQSRKQGDLESARRQYTESLAFARELNETRLIAFDLHSLGLVEVELGNHERAEELVLESLDLVRALGDKHSIALRLQNLAWFALYRGDLVKSEKYLNTGMALVVEMGYKWGICGSYGQKAALRRAQGHPRSALDLNLQAIRMAQELGARDTLIENLEGAAISCALLDSNSAGAQLLGACGALRKQFGLNRIPFEQAEHDRAVERMRCALGDAQFETAYNLGQNLTLEQAVALVT